MGVRHHRTIQLSHTFQDLAYCNGVKSWLLKRPDC
jgi:hypothetical protein